MRSGPIRKEQHLTDPMYKSKVVGRFISYVMKDGELSVAERIVYDVLGKLDADRKVALDSFENAVKNVMPKTEVRSRRVGGATYQVPSPVRFERAEALAMRWIIGAARKRKGKAFADKLLEEIRNARQGIGDAIKKRDDVHKMAEANKAFAHFKF